MGIVDFKVKSIVFEVCIAVATLAVDVLYYRSPKKALYNGRLGGSIRAGLSRDRKRETRKGETYTIQNLVYRPEWH